MFIVIAYTVNVHSAKPGPGKALSFHGSETLGVLYMAMLMSTIHVHSGLHLLPIGRKVYVSL